MEEDVTVVAIDTSLNAPTVTAPTGGDIPDDSPYNIPIETADVDFLWRTDLYENSTDDFGTSSLIDSSYLPRISSYEVPIAAKGTPGTWYYWGVSVNKSGVSGPESSSVPVTIVASGGGGGA